MFSTEEVNKATVHNVGEVLDTIKPRIACRDPRPPKKLIKARYDLKIVSFWALKNRALIAETETQQTPAT